MPPSKFCWDSTVFVTHLTGELRTQDEIDGLNEVVDLADRGAAIIVTCAMAEIEVIGPRGDPITVEKFRALFKRPEFQMVDINPVISQLAGELRALARDDGRSLHSADSTFVATAMAYRLDGLHTFDEGILGLDGKPYVRGLSITKPRGTQTILRLI